MKWEREPDSRDVRNAFVHMTTVLNAQQRPHWIVVDIKSNPAFPMVETIAGAFWGPSRSPAFAEWLVVGSSTAARTIGGTLSRIAKRDNIRWFSTMDEALGYLAHAELTTPASETPL